ncbi:transporter [Frondihabitans sucicola]|uniref:Transporter n=1 Tax=Frondihabitans sucicola TaxID=1268041 RepID=A0ABN6Y058_9MICO|nr:hypothetical protein [Frondihabitans sucicola]BDZ50665.1 transporter [Frondihabitans sucicola]
MSIPLILAGFLVVAVALFFVMRAGWRSRGRRQAGIALPTTAPADLGEALAERDLFYVSTTKADDRLDRIVVGGLGFRARATVSVHPEGVVLDIAGLKPILIDREHLREVGRATWTIDRAVEQDGLVQLGWRLGDLDVDTYLRDSDDPRALVAAIRDMITPTGEKTP